LVLSEILRELVYQIIVVDNGSTDSTSEVARQGDARVVQEPQRGYGRACLSGIAALLPEIETVVFLDADHSDYPAEMERLLDPIQKGIADLVIGSRRLGNAGKGALALHQRFGNWLACRMIQQRWNYRYTDLGPFRAIRRQVLDSLQMQDTAFGWTVEMQVKALQQGLMVMEVPVSYRRRIGRSKISVTLMESYRAGVTIISTILKYR
jgi:glycosyltransferase involved in cell wall biosynthesis